MRTLIVLLLLSCSACAEAYVGPGSGLSVLGSLWAVIVAVVVTLAAVLTWPLRLLWRRLRKPRAEASPPRE